MMIQKVQSNNNIFFRGRVIDSHTHIGNWSADKFNMQESDLLELVNKKLNVKINGRDDIDEVKYVFVSNSDCIDMKDGKPYLNEIDGNQKMLDSANRNPLIKPLAVCQPSYGSAENIKKLLDENPGKFIGLKFHPQMLNLAANDEKYLPYIKLAQDYKLPCLFHSDAVGSLSDPKLIYEVAKKFPEVSFILGHLGLNDYQSQNANAINVMKESIEKGDAKLYADLAWTDVPAIKKAISELKNMPQGDFTNRLLFGTDAPLGEFNHPDRKQPNYYAKRIGEIKSMIETNFKQDAEILTDNIFYKNSVDLFKPDVQIIKDTIASNEAKGGKSGKILMFALLIITGLIGAVALLKKDKPNPKAN